MKVIYKKSIVNKINKKIIKSKKENREIEKIILNEYEYGRLKKELCLIPDQYTGKVMVLGVLVEVE